jgi:ribosomal RNA assembly protein
MSVRTTRKTYDPYIVLKARDLLKLLARGVAVGQAVKILDDGVAADIIKIGSLVRNKERYVKRRQRIIGPDGSTLKAGGHCLRAALRDADGAPGDRAPHTVLRPRAGLDRLRHGPVQGPEGGPPDYPRLHEEYPPYLSHQGLPTHLTIPVSIPELLVQELMIKRELAKDPKLAGESWDRFLPQFRKRHLTTAQKTARKHDRVDAKTTARSAAGLPSDAASAPKKKVYTPFPPAQQPRKVDLQLESGEYFLKASERDARAKKERKEKVRLPVLVECAER